MMSHLQDLSDKGRTIFRVIKRENPFVQISKQIFQNASLSFKAKGILGYLLSRPDNWICNVADIVNHSSDGEHAVRSGIDELIKAGYIIRKAERDEKGHFVRWVMEVHEDPLNNPDRDFRDLDDPYRDFPDVGNPHVGNPLVGNRDINNKELTNIELTNNDLTNNTGGGDGGVLINPPLEKTTPPPTTTEKYNSIPEENSLQKYNAPTLLDAEALYRSVRPSHLTLPRTDKFEAAMEILHRYLDVYHNDQIQAAEALRPFAVEADKRGISQTNLCWLTEWAATGKIPPTTRNTGRFRREMSRPMVVGAIHESPLHESPLRNEEDEDDNEDVPYTVMLQVVESVKSDEELKDCIADDIIRIYHELMTEKEADNGIGNGKSNPTRLTSQMGGDVLC